MHVLVAALLAATHVAEPALSAGSPEAVHGISGETAPKVLVIGIDGLRPDALMRAHTPNIDGLIANGAISLEARTGVVTVSGPGWSSFLTGVWAAKHEVTSNSFTRPRYDRYPHFFNRIKETRPDLVTASFVTWMPLDQYFINADNADFSGAFEYEADGDVRAVAACKAVLAGEDVDVVFHYFADVDVAGHEHGFHPRVEPYLAEIEEVDAQLGELLAAVRSRPTYADEDWLVLLSTDHGGTLDGSHGRDEPAHRRIPYIASGPSAVRGVIYPTPNIVDIPVAAMTHLGIEIDPAWQLDGMASGLPRPVALGENLVVNGDAEASHAVDDVGPGSGTPGWIDTGGMAVIKYGRTEGYPGLTSPGPADRGEQFFTGTGEADCSIEQTVSIAHWARLIDEGAARFRLAADLGGFAEQRDFAMLRAAFVDGAGLDLDAVELGPVTLADRRNEIGGSGDELTGLVHREVGGNVPIGTRLVRLTLTAERGTGQPDGYADNIVFSVERRGVNTGTRLRRSVPNEE